MGIRSMPGETEAAGRRKGTGFRRAKAPPASFSAWPRVPPDPARLAVMSFGCPWRIMTDRMLKLRRSRTISIGLSEMSFGPRIQAARAITHQEGPHRGDYRSHELHSNAVRKYLKGLAGGLRLGFEQADGDGSARPV